MFKEKLCDGRSRGNQVGLLDHAAGAFDEESMPRSLSSSFSGGAMPDTFYSAPMLSPAEAGAMGREARDSLEGEGLATALDRD